MNCKSSHTTGRWQPLALSAALLLTLVACDRREAPIDPAFKNPPPNTAAPTAQYPATTPGDTTDPYGPRPEAKDKGGADAGKAEGGSGNVASDNEPDGGPLTDSSSAAGPSRTREDEK